VSQNRRKKLILVDLAIASKVSLLLGILFFTLFYWLRYTFMLTVSLFLFTLVAPLGAIVSNILSYDGKTSEEKRSGIVIIIILILVLLIGIVMSIAVVSPYIYTPPSLTSENLALYKKCIQYVENHKQYPDIRLSWVGRVAIKDGTYLLGRDFDKEKLGEYFSDEDISEMLKLSHGLKKLHCIKFMSNNDIVLFYNYRNKILPTRPGVAFSLNGENPNKIDSEILNQCKPFIEIGNDWYMSSAVSIKRVSCL